MSIWQTKKWQEMLKESVQVSDFFEVEWIYIEKRKVAFWKFGLFVLWANESIGKNVNKLIELCKKQKALFLQIETIDYNNKLYFIENKKFKKWYYKKFITPHTSVVDLTKTDDEILALMKPKWRYNIKVARKNNIEIKEVNKVDEKINLFYDLMNETTSRDWFSWNSLDYYKNLLNSLDNSKLLLAYKDDKAVAWWIFIFDKEISIYYYWASTSLKKYTNLMAPYLLQWEAIQVAKKYNSKIYDFLWIMTPGDSDTSLKWVTDFKLKLSKDVRNVSDSYIYINKKIQYFIINILRKLK